MPSPSPDIANQVRDASSASREAVLPWLITLPVAAGVFLGAMILGLLILAYLHGQGDVEHDGPAGKTESRLHDSPVPTDTALAPAAPTTTGDDRASLPRLPGLIEANRRRLTTACIAGTVGHRRNNGWVQAVARNTPRRCVATSQ